MRIISGKHRGLKLSEFAGGEIRPTADRVKESLFNIIAPDIAGAYVLDLFAGSGSLGIECLSRGAEYVIFNDVSKDSIKVLKSNLSKLRDCENYGVYNLDFAQCLCRVKRADIIFIDPPYRLEAGIEALKIIADRRILTDGGIAVYERDRAFSGEIAGLTLFDERRYGKTTLSFFKNNL